MMPNAFKVRWRNIIYTVPVCYSDKKFSEVTARWPPDGIIHLKNIFDGTSWPSDQERLLTVNYVFRKCKEPFDASFDVKATKLYLENNG